MPSTHQFWLMNHDFNLIKQGRKSIEVRVADEERKRVKKGDFIIFNRRTTKRIVRVCGYLSFEEMLEQEDPEKIMPRWNKERIINRLRRIYSKTQENQGVLVFELQVDP